MRPLRELVNAADPGELLIAVDRLVHAQEWDQLVSLADQCRAAVELGRQLWPVAMHIDYRLALEAPGPWAAAVCQPGAAKFALGPLTEVAASRHAWEELAPWLPHPASRLAVAQERAIRGEDLRAVHEAHELPPWLTPFESQYALPSYDDRRAGFPEPPVITRPMPRMGKLPSGTAVRHISGDAASAALADVVEVWTTQSRGEVRIAAVEGSLEEAVGSLHQHASVAPVTVSEALAMLQWAGASGGVHGRRRGGAAGRFSAWWAAAALAGLDWPEVTDEHFASELGHALDELTWCRFTGPDPLAGWSLRLAAADPLDGVAFAIEAFDPAEEVVSPTAATAWDSADSDSPRVGGLGSRLDSLDPNSE